jgi:hypothetical protein
MNLGKNVSIESVILWANIPLKSRSDFRFSFYLVAPGLNEITREKLARSVKEVFPALEYSTYGDDHECVRFSVADKDSPGICKHLVGMFQNAGIFVSAMGAPYYEEPPYLAGSPEPKDLPESFKNFEAFKVFVNTAADAALGVSPAKRHPGSPPPSP